MADIALPRATLIGGSNERAYDSYHQLCDWLAYRTTASVGRRMKLTTLATPGARVPDLNAQFDDMLEPGSSRPSILIVGHTIAMLEVGADPIIALLEMLWSEISTIPHILPIRYPSASSYPSIPVAQRATVQTQINQYNAVLDEWSTRIPNVVAVSYNSYVTRTDGLHADDVSLNQLAIRIVEALRLRGALK